MPFIDLFAGLCGNGMLESMLEPHLRETGASTLDVGLSFLVFGCCYMVGNMFFGQVSLTIFKRTSTFEARNFDDVKQIDCLHVHSFCRLLTIWETKSLP